MKARKTPALISGRSARAIAAQEEPETAVDVGSPGALNQMYVNDIGDGPLLTADQEFRIWATLRARAASVGVDPSTACNHAEQRLDDMWHAFINACAGRGIAPPERDRILAEARDMPACITSGEASAACAWLRAQGWGAG